MTTVDIGERIRTKRKERGLSQQELAELASLNYVTVSKYESGKVEPGAKALTRIANALDVTTDELLGLTDQHEDTPGNRKARTIEAQIVSFGMDRLPQEEREKILAILQTMYNNDPTIFRREHDDETQHDT